MSGRAAGAGGAPACGEVPAPKALPPACNTGGNVSPDKVVIDWLNCTFDEPRDTTPHQFVTELGNVIARPISCVLGRGLFGFDQGLKLYSKAGSTDYALGILCWGGEQQRGKWMLQIPGGGCKLVRSWPAMQQYLAELDAKITRVDLAMDFLQGEHTVDDAVQMYRDGQFAHGGRPPSTSTAGDWLDGIKGRTLYVGKATNGKMLRVYEKGIQLGEAGSPWVRFEVQFGNRDRCIPLDILTQPARYLAGAYPALAAMIDDAAIAIETDQKGGQVSLGHLLFWVRRSFGKTLDTVMAHTDCDASELIESVRIVGTPKRVHPSALGGRLTWAQLLAQISRVEVTA